MLVIAIYCYYIISNDTTVSSCSDILGIEVVGPTLVPPGPDNVNDTVTAASSHSDPDTLTPILVNEVIDPVLVPPGPGNVKTIGLVKDHLNVKTRIQEIDTKKLKDSI